MPPFYRDNHIELYAKDCRQMAELADNSVQCVVTSPPYWGLRKYSGEQELIWGDNHCEHQWELKRGGKLNLINAGACNRPYQYQASGKLPDSGLCSLCGAWKGAYGLEPTPEMYVQHTIEILREIRRVLRKDGVVFWNIGDSYSGSWGDSGHRPERTGTSGQQREKNTEWFERTGHPQFNPPASKRHAILKPKDLCLIPFRIAIAAQEDGWWVRSVIIWSKPNPMPESVTNRPTESHEYILMLTKSARYYWDADAVREPHDYDFGKPRVTQKPPTSRGEPTGGKHSITDHSGYYRADGTLAVNPAGRNIRTVWEFPTQPYPEAHFAVFPEKLPELCIKAATPEVGCCSKCGAPWERVIEIDKTNRPILKGDMDKTGVGRYTRGLKQLADNPIPNRQTLGWQPTCKCNADKVPSLVLDPFAGAGTTLWVAKKLNRRAVGYEISEEYCELALERNRQQVLL